MGCGSSIDNSEIQEDNYNGYNMGYTSNNGAISNINSNKMRVVINIIKNCNKELVLI